MIIRLARVCAIVVVLLVAGGPVLQATYCVPPGPAPQPPFPDPPTPPCGPSSGQGAQSGGSTTCEPALAPPKKMPLNTELAEPAKLVTRICTCPLSVHVKY